MRGIFASILAVWFSAFSFGQPNVIYRLDDLTTVHLDSVYVLDASKQKLTELPGILFELKNLQSLNLSKNKLRQLPEQFASLKKLKSLNLSQNSLGNFPSYLCGLDQLEELKLAENKLGSLPECIGFLEKLRVLDLFQTYLTDLPEAFSKLQKLEKHFSGDQRRIWQYLGENKKDYEKEIAFIEKICHIRSRCFQNLIRSQTCIVIQIHLIHH